jgi:hypothetical protein
MAHRVYERVTGQPRIAPGPTPFEQAPLARREQTCQQGYWYSSDASESKGSAPAKLGACALSC